MSIYRDLHSKSPKIEFHDFEKIVNRFGSNRGLGQSDSTKFMDQLWIPFAWAAVLGLISKKNLPLEGNLKKDTFKYQTIYNQSADVFYALVLMVVGLEGHEILDTPERINQVIEEHANGGFEIIYSKLKEDNTYFDDPNNFIIMILDIIEEFENK